VGKKKGDDIREEEDVAAKTRFAREEDERLCSFYRTNRSTDPCAYISTNAAFAQWLALQCCYAAKTW
tara:strand:- start:373 stop:573 length:201 start_codon:yes stop_codon:yes gene_type:complete